MKNLIKILVPLTLAASLFVGCGGDNGTCTGDSDCKDGKICVKAKADDKDMTCKAKCADETGNKCADKTTACSTSADSTPKKFCEK